MVSIRLSPTELLELLQIDPSKNLLVNAVPGAPPRSPAELIEQIDPSKNLFITGPTTIPGGSSKLLIVQDMPSELTNALETYVSSK